MDSYDLAVVGAGPGGYVAAIRAAQNGLKTCVVERDAQLGGTCLLRGCIPTKSLLHGADAVEHAQKALAAGTLRGTVDFNYDAMQAERLNQVKKGAQGVAFLLKKNKVTVLRGHGKLLSPTTLEVTDGANVQQIGAKAIVLATGSKPRDLPHLPRDGKAIVSSNEMLEIKTPPKRLVVLGAGAVGVEFASIFSRLGTHCTVVEMQDRFVPNEDAEVSREFVRILQKRGIDCLTKAKCTGAKPGKDGLSVSIEVDGATRTLAADVLLVATGRAPVTDNLGLDAVGVKTDARGYIAVDANLHTGVGSIYAIGDVINTPWLAHVASSEGIFVADLLAGKKPPQINYALVPGCTYSNPEIGSVGLSEEAAKAKGYAVKVGKFPFSAVAKARILGNTDGFVKIVCDSKYDEILGVHIVGPHATDLIAEACVAMRLECTGEELAHTMHAHPSLAESVLEAAHAATGPTLHM